MFKSRLYPNNCQSCKFHRWAFFLLIVFLKGCGGSENYIVQEIGPASFLETLGVQAKPDTGLVLFHGDGTNLIENGGFDHWDKGPTAAPAGWENYRGLRLLQMFYGDEVSIGVLGSPGDDFGRLIYSQPISLIEGESIVCSADIRSPKIQNGAFFLFYIQLRDHKGKLITPGYNGKQLSTGWNYSPYLKGWGYAVNDGKPKDGWQHITTSVFTAPLGSNAKDIIFSFHPLSKTQFLADNVVIKRVFSQRGIATSAVVAVPFDAVSFGTLEASVGLAEISISKMFEPGNVVQSIQPSFSGLDDRNRVYCLTNNGPDHNLGESFVYRYRDEPSAGDMGNSRWEGGLLTDANLAEVAYAQIKPEYRKTYVEFDFQGDLWVQKFETHAAFLNSACYLEALEVQTSQDGVAFTRFGSAQAPQRSQLTQHQKYMITVSGVPVQARYVRMIWYKPTWSPAFWITEARVWGKPDPAARVTFRTRTAASPEGFALAPLTCSEWSQPFRVGDPIPSPPNRYLQYQVALRRILPTVSPMVSNIRVGIGY